MAELTVYDHVRPTDTDLAAGIYRVVGTSEDAVTLLWIGDGDGHRVHTGEVVTVDRDALEGFDPAENPTDTRSIGATLTGVPKTIYWQLRAFGSALAANPIPSVLFATATLVGTFAPPVLSTSDPILDGLVLAGALGLAYVGSGRF